MTHGWQSESTDGPTGVWSCVFFFAVVAMVAVVTSPQLLDVVWCSAVVVVVVEGSLEVKLPTIWTDEKQRWEESERREEYKREK